MHKSHPSEENANRLTVAANEGKTLLEVWFGHSITYYDNIYVFSYPVYYHVRKSKLDRGVKKAIFLDFNTFFKGFRLWCLKTKMIIYNRDNF